MLKYRLLAVCMMLAFGAANTQAHVWQPAPGHTQMPIWPDIAPDHPEELTQANSLVAGKPWSQITDVTQPTITVYPPSGKNTGAAVMVLPGGGYRLLAIDLEGNEACDWLTSQGITCILLKYRVPFSGPYWDEQCQCHMTPKAPLALQDAQRALSIIRHRAVSWHIDPHKIGVLGFSAGGHLAALLSTHFDARSYPAMDEADKESCRPDFAAVLYPGHMLEDSGLNPDIRVTGQTPPTFLLQAEDDPIDSVENSLVYYAALQKAHVPVEMHLYANGGHAFGLRRTEFPITQWPPLMATWLATIGIIQP